MNELIPDILRLVFLTAGSAVPGVVEASAKDDAIESVGRSVGVFGGITEEREAKLGVAILAFENEAKAVLWELGISTDATLHSHAAVDLLVRASVGVDEFDGACTFPGDSGLTGVGVNPRAAEEAADGHRHRESGDGFEIVFDCPTVGRIGRDIRIHAEVSAGRISRWVVWLVEDIIEEDVALSVDIGGDET